MFLGVDGGGSKTALCLLDLEGQIPAEAQVGSCYYFTEGIGLVERVLEEGVGEVCERAGIAPSDIAYAFFGLPSYGEVSGDVAALDATPKNVLGHERYACGNDMICGWAGSLGGADGINVISGTGSMTYGERAGIGVRVGGWGELFGDEGSAYWVAIRGLNAFTRMSDGRLPVGPLYEIFCDHLALDADLDLVDVILNDWKGDRGEIASLSRMVVKAARDGDAEAERIIEGATAELAELVDVTRRRLDFQPDEKVLVSYSGGMFGAEVVLEGFRGDLAKLHDGYELRRPLFTPVVGGALYAARLAGESLEVGNLKTAHREPRVSMEER